MTEKYLGNWRKVRSVSLKPVHASSADCPPPGPEVALSSSAGSLPYRGLSDSCILWEGSAFRQIRGTQRKLLPAFVDFETLSAQTNPYATVAYSGPLHRSHPHFTESITCKGRGGKGKGKEERKVGTGYDQIFFRQCMNFRENDMYILKTPCIILSKRMCGEYSQIQLGIFRTQREPFSACCVLALNLFPWALDNVSWYLFSGGQVPQAWETVEKNWKRK